MDAISKAEPGEPIFPLLGRDRASPLVIKIWAHLWMQEIALGLRPESDRSQVLGALKIATEMEIWHRDRETRRKHEALTFDDRGIPMTGEHARKENATTSGANE